MARGGLRANKGGRPKEAPTKVVRLTEEVAAKVKSGYFEELEALIEDWQARAEDADTNTRNWVKMNEFLAELKQLKDTYQ